MRSYRVVRRWAAFSAAGVICGGVGDVTWHAGDMEGARSVVDAGDVGMWLLLLGICHGLWAAWVVGCGGGDLMKTEGVSQLVTRVNLDQHSNTRARSRSRRNL